MSYVRTFGNVNIGYFTTVTAAGTTTLTSISEGQQYFTGSTTQTVVLPVTDTLLLGQSWYIKNLSSGTVTINSSGGNLVYSLTSGNGVLVKCILRSGTSAASWDTQAFGGAAYTDEQAQDAVGGMVDSSLVYVDGTPLLQRAALTGDVTASAGSNATTIATPSSATVATDDKVLIKDTSASDATKYVTAQSIADIVPGSGTMTSAQLRTALTDETGTGAAYFAGGDVGTPSAGVLSNCSGYPSDWIKISTATASNSTSIDFTGLTSTYAAYRVLITGLLPATNAVEFLLRTSTNNGSSYDSSAGNYQFVIQGTAASTVGGRNTSATAIELMDSTLYGTLSSTSTDKTYWEVLIYNPSAANYCVVQFQGAGTLTNVFMMYGGGYRISSADVDAIRFLMSSGNISTGIFTLYGLRA